MDGVVLAETAQTLPALLLHPVVQAGLAPADAARARHAESLRGGSVGLHLRHDARDSEVLRSGRPPSDHRRAVCAAWDAGGAALWRTRPPVSRERSLHEGGRGKLPSIQPKSCSVTPKA